MLLIFRVKQAAAELVDFADEFKRESVLSGLKFFWQRERDELVFCVGFNGGICDRVIIDTRVGDADVKCIENDLAGWGFDVELHCFAATEPQFRQIGLNANRVLGWSDILWKLAWRSCKVERLLGIQRSHGRKNEQNRNPAHRRTKQWVSDFASAPLLHHEDDDQLPVADLRPANDERTGFAELGVCLQQHLIFLQKLQV